MLAFDDGYADNHDVVLPILKRAKVPATFFIPTAFPDAGKLFWWDRISLIMNRCREPWIELTYPAPLRLTPRQDPEQATRLVCKIIKHTPGVDLNRAWEDLERASGVHISEAEERAIADRTIMGWSKIKALRAAGMSVESHSHAHRVLGTLTPDEATKDLQQSRAILQDQLGEPVHAVAYPVGYELTGPFRRVAHDAGFELAFTNATGICSPKSDPWNLPRLSMDRLHVGALYKLRLLLGDRHRDATAA
jgi:peptidoglycan/xylan/chitin deacetylase (PgdA/CDA1 family)